MIYLPTLPYYCKFPNDHTFEFYGRAVTDSFECSSGRFFPMQTSGISEVNNSNESDRSKIKLTKHRGLFLVRIGKYQSIIPGAEYKITGRIKNDKDLLHAPILLRYKPQAVIEPAQGGYQIEKYSDPSYLHHALNYLKYHFTSHLSWGVGKTEGELLAGITLGKRGRRLGSNWTCDFTVSGISHLIVASGAQLSILCSPLFFILHKIKLSRVLRWCMLILSICFIFLLALFLGMEPSILRAAVMGTITLLSIGFGRCAAGSATLSTTALFWLIQNPMLSRDSAFLLSLSASFGIIFIAPLMIHLHPIERVREDFNVFSTWNPFLKFTVAAIKKTIDFMIFSSMTTLAAQTAITPVLAITAERLSFAGFLSNIFAIPIGQIILLLGAISSFSGFASFTLCLQLNTALDNLAKILITIAHDFKYLPFANFSVPAPPLWLIPVWFLAWAVVVQRWQTYRARFEWQNSKNGKASNVNSGVEIIRI